MRKKRLRRIIAAILIVGLVMNGTPGPMSAYADSDIDVQADEVSSEMAQSSDESREEDVAEKYQDQIEEYNEKLETLEAERKQIQQSINAAKTEKEKETLSKNAIEQQIGIAQQEIGVLMDRYTALERSIEAKQNAIVMLQAEIDNKQKSYDDSYQQYLMRLRSMQINNEGTMLGVLLGADSYSEFLSTGEMMRRISEHDRNLIQQIKEERIGLEADKSAVDDEIAALNESKNALDLEKINVEVKKQDLSAQQQLVQQKIQDIERMEREFMGDLENNKKIEAQMKAELDRIFQEIEWSKNPYVGSAMIWPVAGYRTITSPYGWRFNNSDFHTGTDISGSGINGKEVLAANDGTVSFTNWSNVPGKGYGIYIIIDHGITESGDSLSTLYAHLSNIQVSPGQAVKRGDVIGNVGSTGWSTGPHLHFEVRLNKQHTNSLPYIQGS